MKQARLLQGLKTLRACTIVILLCVNTLVLFVPFLLICLLKWLPIAAWQRACTAVINGIVNQWVYHNNQGIKILLPTQFYFSGLTELNLKKSYLIVANHQSWLDIVVLQRLFYKRIPQLKFFLKDELKWVPILNIVWMGLDYPFMKRYSRAYLEKHPKQKGRDMAATIKSCKKFEKYPVSIMNFVEGTRFTEEKKFRQQSPYQQLLKPRAGGIGYTLQAMGQQLNQILDVTIAYKGAAPSLWQFLKGEVARIRVHVNILTIPDSLYGNYSEDSAYQTHLKNWLNTLWHEKQTTLERLQVELNYKQLIS